jgi:hypothetical protein
MKKSELTTFIKEEILSTLNESPSSEEVRMAKQAVSRFMKYRNVGQDEAIRDLKNALDVLKSSMEEATIETPFEKLPQVKKQADKDDIIKVTEEDEDAPAGDAEIEKKASKQDQIINNYKRLQKDLKKHLEMYKDAEGDSAKKAALQMMKKISQSAEYLDAKAKYEKLKQVK